MQGAYDAYVRSAFDRARDETDPIVYARRVLRRCDDALSYSAHAIPIVLDI